MADFNMFEALVQYHCKVNLPKCLPNVSDGVIKSADGRPMTVGSDRGQLYAGIGVLSDGKTLVGKLMDDELGSRIEGVDEFQTIGSKRELSHYLRDQEEGYLDEDDIFVHPLNNDGIYIFDREKSEIVRVRHLDNTPPSPSLEGMTLKRMNAEKIKAMMNGLHPDALSYKGNMPILSAGSKTQTMVPYVMLCDYVEGDMIKASAYTGFGMGPVVHVEKECMTIFYIDSKEEHGEHKVFGGYRYYERDSEGKLARVKETVSPSISIDRLKALNESKELSGEDFAPLFDVKRHETAGAAQSLYKTKTSESFLPTSDAFPA